MHHRAGLGGLGSSSGTQPCHHPPGRSSGTQSDSVPLSPSHLAAELVGTLDALSSVLIQGRPTMGCNKRLFTTLDAPSIGIALGAA